MTDSGRPKGVTRREALKRGAAIAGAVWAVPAMQVLNMSAAHAHGDQHNNNGVSNEFSPASGSKDEESSSGENGNEESSSEES